MATEEPNGAATIYQRVITTWLNNVYERDLKALKERVEKLDDVNALEELQNVFQDTKDFVERRARIGQILDRAK